MDTGKRKKPENQTPSGGFIPIDQVIAKLTASFMERPRGKARFLSAIWSRAVGEQMARHSQPERLTNGLLTVRVDSPVWATQMIHMKPGLLAAIQKCSPDSRIRDLRLIQGTLRTSIDNRVQRPAEQLPPPLPEESDKATRMVASVSDPDLRNALGRLYQTILVRRRCG
ncbi:MAG: DUF721 domain-containing protein [Magnetococcales bacterium]|nr:DUF721 domain-containing protein [Magnetococcales bacterium]MBF0151321.1 DUF721 domain-containing protein [Magnetococcales bacterium]MBF0174227.1 DUF721 domain-containing protein [Magnetococcales bacterium]MBF0347258.1 DUF721 domain-containing protein [Magnetococcales bacterium]MBF0632224.1 DUF721 domain-containing protein [Magnetococcales bacterium]